VAIVRDVWVEFLHESTVSREAAATRAAVQGCVPSSTSAAGSAPTCGSGKAPRGRKSSPAGNTGRSTGGEHPSSHKASSPCQLKA
jgi:hypothetical protein